jgi:hypothetical protein
MNGYRVGDFNMDIILLPANNAYCLIMGTDIGTSNIIDVQGQRFWNTRKELLGALGFKSMKEFRENLARTE